MNVAYLGWCPTQTVYTAYSIVHIPQTGPQGHFSVGLQRGRGSSPPVNCELCASNIIIFSRASSHLVITPRNMNWDTDSESVESESFG